MTAAIIPFPGLIDRVAKRFAQLMGASSEQTFGRVIAEPEIKLGPNGAPDLNPEQWAAVWRRVDELMSENNQPNGNAA